MIHKHLAAKLLDNDSFLADVREVCDAEHAIVSSLCDAEVGRLVHADEDNTQIVRAIGVSMVGSYPQMTVHLGCAVVELAFLTMPVEKIGNADVFVSRVRGIREEDGGLVNRDGADIGLSQLKIIFPRVARWRAKNPLFWWGLRVIAEKHIADGTMPERVSVTRTVRRTGENTISVTLTGKPEQRK